MTRAIPGRRIPGPDRSPARPPAGRPARPRAAPSRPSAPAPAAAGPAVGGTDPTTHHGDVQTFLERFARAFSRSDLAEIARCHTLPALVLTDTSSSLFESTTAIAEGFRDVVAEHRRQNLVSTVFRLEAVKALSDHLTEITVRWTYRDDRGRPRFHQRCRYVLRHDPEAGFRVQTVIVLGDAER